MAILGQQSTKAAGGNAVSPTVNMSLVSLFVALVCSDTNPPTLTDLTSNVWVRVGTVQAAAFGTSFSSLYYVANPSVSASHTFTCCAGTTSLCVIGFSGTGASPLDDFSEAGAQSPPARAGSKTPSKDGSVVVFGAGGFDTTGVTLDVVAKTEDQFAAAGVNYGSTLGYVIQGAATAANPGVTVGDFTFGVHNAIFKPFVPSLPPYRFARQAVNRSNTY